MEFVAKTDVGKKRANNEDSFFAKIYNDDIALFIVADGLGGYASGEVASSILVDKVSSHINEHLNILASVNSKKVMEIIQDAISISNEYIYNLEKTDDKYKGMGTTAVIVLSIKNTLFYTSIGDSRIYFIDSKFKDIKQLTEDDTYVNELIRTNVITKEEAINHPQKHMLTKAIGVLKNITFDIKKIKNTGGYMLLCTDGVTNTIDDKDILSITKKNKFSIIADKIVSQANDNGGIDNITIVVIEL